MKCRNAKSRTEGSDGGVVGEGGVDARGKVVTQGVGPDAGLGQAGG